MTEARRRSGSGPPTARVPPHDLATEAGLLGAMLYNPAVAIPAALQTGLTAGDFYKPAHGHIYHAIVTLHAAGEPTDAITVAAHLRADGLVDAIGGPTALVTLMADSGIPAHAAKYAQSIIDAAGARRMLAATAEIADSLYAGKVPNGALTSLNQMAERAARSWRTDSITVSWGEPADPPRPAPVLIDGFLRQGELAAIAAPRGLGKSALVYNLAKLLADGHGRFLGCLDVQRPARVLIAQGELEPWQSHSRWQRLGGKPKNVAETWDPWRVRVQRHRRPTSEGGWDEWTEATIDAGLEQAIVDDGVEVLVIDPWRTYYSGTENSNDEVEQAAAALTALSRRTGVAIVVIHHLSFKGDHVGKEPEDLWRGASRLADWVSTRVTILPHYSAKAADDAGLSRAVARRHVDVHFLRRAEPTEDFCAVRNDETGWWEHWADGKVGAGRAVTRPNQRSAGRDGTAGTGNARDHYRNVVEALEADGGSWPSVSAAAVALGKTPNVTKRLLETAAELGLLESFPGVGTAIGYRLPTAAPPSLNFEDDAAPWPDEPPAGDE